MTVGMSAPPMRMTNSTPNSSERTTSAGNMLVRAGSPTSAAAMITAAPRIERFTTFWPGYTAGRSGNKPWSLPNAIRLPVNVRNPSSTSMPRATMVNRSMPGARR